MKYLAVAILLLMLWIPSAEGQVRPEVFIVWSTTSFVPDGYTGKPLPSPGSHVTATVFVLSGNKLANISSANIKWFIDGESFKEGLGMNKIEFSAPRRAGMFLSIRAQIVGMGDSILSKTIEMPILNPQVVISTPITGNEFFENNLIFKARPFYFNIASKEALNFSWKVNRQEPVPSTSPDELIVNVSNPRSGYKIQVNLSATNETGDESASALRNLIYSK